MCYKFHILICFLACASLAAAQWNSTSRCFQFTWLGPRYNNESVFLNATCQEATRLASGVPCQEPLVASYDGSWPNVDYIWRNYGQQASCVLANNDVCAQYTYYFNGHPENSTYMCTRAVDTNGTAIGTGCYEEVAGSYRTRVCFCRSVPGGVPCNYSNNIKACSILLLVLSILYLFYNKNIF